MRTKLGWALRVGAALGAALAACAPPAVSSRAPIADARGSPVSGAPGLGVPAPGAPGLVAGGHVKVTFLDVGQGDSALVTTDDGASLLVDLGPKDAADRVRKAMEGHQGASTTVLLSHAHADHMGDLDTFAHDVRIGAFWDSGFAERPAKTYPRALDVFASRRVPHVVARRGMHMRLGAHADVEVLAPHEPLHQGTRSDPNANSVVVRLTHQGTEPASTVRFLFTGDAEAPTEQRLLEARETVSADVLKIAHHGSKHASSAGFLRAVGAKIAIISCASDNDYGHPHLATLKRVSQASMTLHRTDLEGDITVDSEDGRVLVTPSRAAPESLLMQPGRTPSRGAESAP